METPKAARRWLAERGDSPSAHASAAHSPGLPAPVYSRRAMPERPTAVGASVSDGCDLILAEVYDGLVGGSALGEDWALEARAGVGAFVGEGLDLSGDEPYSFHGREFLLGLFVAPDCIRISRLFLYQPFLGRLQKSEGGGAAATVWGRCSEIMSILRRARFGL